MSKFYGLTARTTRWPVWAKLAGTVALILAALSFRFATMGEEPGYPYALMFLAVMVASVLFGRWPGALTTLVGAASVLWFFVPPTGKLLPYGLRDSAAALGFAAAGFCFVWISAEARRALESQDAANRALREGQDRLRTVLENIGEPFYAVDADWRIRHASRAALEIWGRRADQVIGRTVLDAFPEAAGSAPFAALEEVMRTRRAARLEAVSGVTKRWVAVDIYPASDGGLSVAFRDIHGRKQAEDRQRLLVRELTHRIKNSLALVLAIADQTRRSASSPDAFHAVFSDRIAALARAHDALQRDGGTETTLQAVAREALAPHGDGHALRVDIAGPELRIGPGRAVALAMAFHELATNAAKYGALSCPGGRVALSWKPVAGADPAERWHEILWEETGGPTLAAPPGRRGFGTRLLEQGLARQVGGSVSLAFASTGVSCRILFPARDEAEGEAALPQEAGQV